MEQVWLAVQKVAPLVARILLAHVFILSGVSKIARFGPTAQMIASVDIPAANLVLMLVIALEVGGGLMLLAGWQARWAAAAFCFFILCATMIFHPFWKADAAAMPTQLNNFMKNFALIGGMLYVVVYGAGPLSIDNRLRRAAGSAGAK